MFQLDKNVIAENMVCSISDIEEYTSCTWLDRQETKEVLEDGTIKVTSVETKKPDPTQYWFAVTLVNGTTPRLTSEDRDWLLEQRQILMERVDKLIPFPQIEVDDRYDGLFDGDD